MHHDDDHYHHYHFDDDDDDCDDYDKHVVHHKDYDVRGGRIRGCMLEKRIN